MFSGSHSKQFIKGWVWTIALNSGFCHIWLHPTHALVKHVHHWNRPSTGYRCELVRIGCGELSWAVWLDVMPVGVHLDHGYTQTHSCMLSHREQPPLGTSTDVLREFLPKSFWVFDKRKWCLTLVVKMWTVSCGECFECLSTLIRSTWKWEKIKVRI